MKLGVLGGTFDPVHLGHLVIAEEARTRLGLDEIVFVPAGKPWMKAHKDIAAGHHRAAMVELAVAGNPAFSSSDIEICSPGPAYTASTLEALRSRLGARVEMYTILGMDSLWDIERWHEPRRIFELSTVVAMSRPGTEKLDKRRLSAFVQEAAVLLEGPAIEISATDIRRRAAQGLSIKQWVPEAVEAYIYKHDLYRLAGK